MRAALYDALRVLRDNLEAERDRWALWLPVAMGGGIGLYFSLPRQPPLAAGPVALGACTLLLLVALRRRPALRYAAYGLIAVALGFAAAELRTASVAAPMLTDKLEAVQVQARVDEVEPMADSRRLLLDQVVIDGQTRAPDYIRLRLARDDTPLAPGDRIRVRANLGPPSRPVAPGAFDFRRQFYFDRIGGIGFVLGHVHSLPDAPATAAKSLVRWIMGGFADLRSIIESRISAALSDADQAGVAIAYVTGIQTAVSPAALVAMRNAGLAHLLAVAGLHLGLATGILFFASRALLALIPAIALNRPIKKWAAAIALLGAVFYTLLTGARVPVVRSCLMAAFVLLGIVVDRRPISMRPVAWAAFAILLLRPESMMGASFQLSFAAIVALTAIWERIGRGRNRPGSALGRLLRELFDLIITSLTATLATAAFGIYQFDRMSNYGLVANILAVPITGFWVMPWLILSLLLMPLGLECLALAPAGLGIGAILWTARTVSSWPGAIAIVPAMPVAGIAMIALGGLWLCLWRRAWRFAGLAGVAAGFALMLWVRAPDILVAEDAGLVAVKASDGSLKFSSARADRFVAEEWLRDAGQTDRSTWAGLPADRLTCQGTDCRYRLGKREVAILEDGENFVAACSEADLVITLQPAPAPCRAPLIDPASLARDGGYAVWLSGSGVRIESVRDLEGDWPWSAEPSLKPAGDP
ncbi:MAG TPA: ComEC/Rec2 family competence protein [Candidatus Udaeobacter sp.]|nr:ComEC/Rec2 family competence protein [Candidatus Udaeobacter sp.]